MAFEVNLVYDEPSAGYNANAIRPSWPSVYSLLARSNLKVNIFSTVTRPLDQVAFYPVELSALQCPSQYLHSIPPESLAAIKDLGSRCYLLLWFPVEGYSLGAEESLPADLFESRFDVNKLGPQQWKWGSSLAHSFSALQIPSTKVCVVWGDANIQKNIKLCKPLADCKAYSYLLFENVIANLEPDSTVTKTPKPQAVFLYKNRACRQHRLSFAQHLYHSGLLRYALFSWLEHQWLTTSRIEQYTSKVGSLLNIKPITQADDHSWSEFLDFIAQGPYVLDIDKSNQSKSIPANTALYQSTYFSFVTETLYNNETLLDEALLFVTEKTFQSMQCRHPFVIAGCANTLEFLRQSGYATFPELFDESYDTLVDPDRRGHAIIQVLKDTCSRQGRFLARLGSNAVQDKLAHNQRLLSVNTANARLQELFTAMTNDIIREQHDSNSSNS